MKNHGLKLVFCLVIVFSLTACKKNPYKVSLRGTKVDVEFAHFERDVFEMSNRADLFEKYPLFFPPQQSLDQKNQLVDHHLNDKITRDIYLKTKDVFKEYKELDEELDKAFSHIKYYFPVLQTPKVFTYLSSLAFTYPIKINDNEIAIGVDCYLGDMKMYEEFGVPTYKARWMNKNVILVDMMREIVQLNVGIAQPQKNNLVQEMILEGKIMYFTKSMLPDVNDSILLKYTALQMEYAERNEGNIYGYFIENELLYSTEKEDLQSFMDDGPFTAQLAKFAPARLGQFMGWKIVEKYMENNDVSLAELLQEEDYRMIFQKSKYKPKKVK